MNLPFSYYNNNNNNNNNNSRSILTDKTMPFNRPDVTFMNEKTKNTFDRHSCPKYTQSRQNNNQQTKQVPRTGK